MDPSLERLFDRLFALLRLLDEQRLRGYAISNPLLVANSLRRLQQAKRRLESVESLASSQANVRLITAEAESLRRRALRSPSARRLVHMVLPRLLSRTFTALSQIETGAPATSARRKRTARDEATTIGRSPREPRPRAVFEIKSRRTPVPDAPERYANAVLLEPVRRSRLDSERTLEPGQVVSLRLDIGKLSQESHVKLARVFPGRLLPQDIDLDVMVSSTDFAVAKRSRPLDKQRIAHGRFFLPGNGSPAIAPDKGRFLWFNLKAPKEPMSARCRIGYYYRNILVQSQLLTASVGLPGGFGIATDFTISKDLTQLEDIPQRSRVSVLTNSNGLGVHQVVLRSVDPASKETTAGTFTVNEATLGPTLTKIRSALSDRAPTRKPRRRAELEADLRALAPLGWTLFSQLPAQNMDVFGTLLSNPEALVLQVLRPTTSDFALPWSLMYEIPMPENQQPEVCPIVKNWDESQPLVTSELRQCPHGPHVENVLCPFGFWGFRYAIEQLSSTDDPVLEIRAAGKCDFVVAQTQFGVDLDELAKHVGELRKTLSTALPAAHLVEAKDKNTIRTSLGKDLPLVYFYCHGERQNVADTNPWLTVGKREPITAKDFIGWITSWRLAMKRVWNEVRPLVFLNACHSLAIHPTTLLSFLDAFVGTARAAGVIGTEVKVQQELAAKVAERFYSLLLTDGQTVEAALRTIRMEYLSAGNLLGLVYTPYCWSELKITKT